MKRNILLLILFLGVVNLSGQIKTDKKNLIGTHIAFGKGNFYDIGTVENKYYYSLGIDYSRKLSEHFDLCSGMEYTYHIYGLYSDYYLKLVTIPAQLKYHLGKLIYFNGGLFINVSTNKNSFLNVSGQWESTKNFSMPLGCGLGVGFEYEFDSGIVLLLNPYARWYGIGESDYHFFQSGVSFGVGKKF